MIKSYNLVSSVTITVVQKVAQGYHNCYFWDLVKFIYHELTEFSQEG